MDFAVIEPRGVHSTRKFAYAHAVRMGNLVFVAGQVAYDQDGKLVGQGDVRAQTEQVFKNLEAVLREAGSGLDKIGKMTVFITNLDYRPIVHELRARVFEKIGHYPASTLAVVTSLADPNWLVEIEAVAVV